MSYTYIIYYVLTSDAGRTNFKVNKLACSHQWRWSRGNVIKRCRDLNLKGWLSHRLKKFRRNLKQKNEKCTRVKFIKSIADVYTT